MRTLPPERNAALAVIDTNVLLDWLVFDDPRVAGLAAALKTGELRWIATAAMRDELAAVLARGFGPRRPVAVGPVWQAWDRHASVCPAGATGLATPRCRDPGDQMFIDLAVVQGGGWLLTRDRAVLQLAGRLRAHGVEVATPERWAAVWPDGRHDPGIDRSLVRSHALDSQPGR